MARCKEETQSAVSPNQAVELVRKAVFRATKNAQIETKAKVTNLCIKQNIQLEGRAKSKVFPVKAFLFVSFLNTTIVYFKFNYK